MSNFDAINVLLIEDNPGDVRLTEEAFRESRMLCHLHVVGDGDAALDYLLKQGAYAKEPRPDLILLDWNLPRRSGREVLEQIKQNVDLRIIPVVVLTTSAAEEDVLRAYNLNANCYITKPVDFDQFIRIVHTIDDFWLTVVKLPGRL